MRLIVFVLHEGLWCWVRDIAVLVCLRKNVIITTLHSPTQTPELFLWIYPVNLVETPRQCMSRQSMCVVECQFSWDISPSVISAMISKWNDFELPDRQFHIFKKFLATTWAFAEYFVTDSSLSEHRSSPLYARGSLTFWNESIVFKFAP